MRRWQRRSPAPLLLLFIGGVGVGVAVCRSDLQARPRRIAKSAEHKRMITSPRTRQAPNKHAARRRGKGSSNRRARAGGLSPGVGLFLVELGLACGIQAGWLGGRRRRLCNLIHLQNLPRAAGARHVQTRRCNCTAEGMTARAPLLRPGGARFLTFAHGRQRNCGVPLLPGATRHGHAAGQACARTVN